MADDLDRLARALGGPAPRAALEEFVAELFGRPAPPDVSRIGVLPTVVTSSITTTRSSRRVPLLVVGAAALVAGGLGWQAGRAAEPERAPSVVPIADVSLDVSVAAGMPGVEAEPQQSAPSSRAAPPKTPARVDATPTSASAAPQAAPPRSRSTAKKRRKPGAAPAEPAQGLESMLPPSAKSAR
jgi:hypothetical protein